VPCVLSRPGRRQTSAMCCGVSHACPLPSPVLSCAVLSSGVLCSLPLLGLREQQEGLYGPPSLQV
jgi:hypothetical protein